MSPLPPSLSDVLISYLEGQKAAGVREIPWRTSLPGEHRITPPPPPPPPTPKAPAPLDKEPTRPVLPSTPKPPPVAEPVSPSIRWTKAVRHPDCCDTEWPDQGWILVVSDQEEFQGESGDLLSEMLKAIGFVMDPETSGYAPDFPAGAVRILVLGDDALQVVSTAGMKLQLIRGLWQNSPHGRLIATYAPSAITGSPSGKKTVWGDLQILLSDLGLEIPEWTRKKLKRS